MFRTIARAAAVVATAVAIAGAGGGRTALAASQSPAGGNRGVVELETGPADDGSVRLALEIAGIVDGGTTRLVPVVGRGPLQNLADLKYLRGIDLAIVQTDVLDDARAQSFPPGIASLTYVAKLYNEEFHLLARPGVNSVNDLAGQTVNVDLKESGTAVTAKRLFGLLGVAAKVTTDTQSAALEQLRRGEIAAIAYLAADPAPFFRALKAGGGLHLLNIPLTRAVTTAYAAARITAADYPSLVAPDRPIDTVAVGTVLMAADLRAMPERDRALAAFIDRFFAGFRGLLAPGYDPKWREVDLAADLPGWTRTPAAAEWLRHNPRVAARPNPPAAKALFSRFIEERRRASGGAAMSAAEKDALFQEFEAWQRGQDR